MPPVLAIAEALVAGGHEVVVLSQPSVRSRAEAAGCAFLPFSELADYDRHRPLEDQLALTVPAITGRAVGDDLTAAAAHDVDVIVVDANLAGALAAAEALGQPTAVLLHSVYKTFVDTWFADLWPFLGDVVNQTRASFGLGAADGWPSVFAGHERLLSVVPAVFDAPVAHVPASMRHFGFLVPQAAPASGTVDFPPGDGPTVLVGLSTTYQAQAGLLQRTLDAVAVLPVRALVSTSGIVDPAELRSPPNATVAPFVPYGRVLGATDVMVTHAGAGSVAAALEAGVPLVCTPISRDQPINAQRVADLDAGIALGADPSAADITAAVERVLGDPGYRAGAAALAAASAASGGPPAAAAELAALAH